MEIVRSMTKCLNKPKQSLGRFYKQAGGTTLPHFSSMTIHNLFLTISDFVNVDPIPLSKEDTELILSYIETDGFNYTFTSKSSFDDVKNADFHKLRLAYLEAEDKLENYLKMCAKHHGIQF